MKLGMDVVPISPGKHDLKKRSDSFPASPKLKFASQGLAGGSTGLGSNKFWPFSLKTEGCCLQYSSRSRQQIPTARQKSPRAVISYCICPLSQVRGFTQHPTKLVAEHSPDSYPPPPEAGHGVAKSSFITPPLPVGRPPEGRGGRTWTSLPCPLPRTAPPTWPRRTSPPFW